MIHENRKEYEDFLIKNVQWYNVVAFRGKGVVERARAETLPEARRAASRLYKNKPVAIYAVAKGGAACHLENWEPQRRK